MKSRVISFSSLAGALVFSAGIGFSRAHGAPAISMSSPTTDYVPMPAESSLRPPSEVLARSQGQAPAPAVKTAAVPVVSSFEESLPSNPSDAEIISSHILEVHLAPQAKETVPGENTALGAAMAEFRSNPETPASLEGFLKAYPNTRWRAAVLLNIGLAYRNQARWSKVMPIWEEAWQISQHESSEGMKGIADRSLGELVNIYARLGRMDDLRRLFAETKGREITGAGAILVRGARQGLGLMETHPEEGFRCGPLALARLYTVAHPNSPIPIKIDGFKSTSRGTNLDQVHEWSEELGLGFQVAYRNPGADVLVPSVINWKVGHYAALTAAEGGAYLSQDSTFGVNNVVTREAIDAEASGYFLVRTGALPAGWRPVSPDEAKLVFGKGNAGTAGPTPTANTASKAGGDSGATCGMTTYSFNSTNASLMLKDTPVGYRPPIGPAIEFTVNYSSLEPSDQSFVTNLGLGWSSQWLSYLHIAQNQASGTIVCFGPGGGELEFVGYNSSTGTFAPQLLSHDVLVKTSASSYTLNHADGSFDTYDLSDGSSTPNIFRTSSTDRFGNKVHYGYDSNLRLVSLTDAIGQVTTLQYGLTTDSTKGDFYRITKVSDPFGRSASFAYNSGVLTSITDVLGIQSSYTYGASAFVTSVTTPYGTTSFSTYGDGVHTVGITAKDAWVVRNNWSGIWR